jgi:uncharacterized protein (DUF488 family)
MKTYKLLTIGYEGREIDEFIDCLKQFNISRLIDVREIPLSRKRGFSKSALRKRLEIENIQYIHIKELGSPSSIRNKLKSDWDYESFLEEYSEYLSGNDASIKELYQYITDGINCIMCFERCPKECHRSVIIDKIQEYDGNRLKIKHI